jgi:hypothetical protein
MNYSYLFVDNLNGHPYIDGFNELKTSVSVLKKIEKYSSIHIFNNETSGKTIDYCKAEGLNHNLISISKNYSGSNSVDPISILVEKIISLKNFDSEQEIVLMDIDTAFTQKSPDDIWNSNYAVLSDLEYYLMDWRYLYKVLPYIPWKEIDVNFDNSFPMYNTGVIYIPKKFRKEICEKALWIVDYLNNGTYKPEDRCGNKLDEQIALSIVLHDIYGKYNHIKLAKDFIYHFWAEKQNGIKWWENYV